MKRAGAALLTLSVAWVVESAVPARAHEFWVEPEPNPAASGEPVRVRLYVGERFAGEEVGYAGGHALDFRHFWAGGEERLRGEEGVGPAAVFVPEEQGLHLISYSSYPSTTRIPAETFNAYLLEDGLYVPLAERRGAGRLQHEGRERFSRYCKTFLNCSGTAAERHRSSSASTSLWGAALGHRLEIVPETDPSSLAGTGAVFRGRLLFDGRPLEGAVVFSSSKSDPGAARSRLTGEDGRFHFTVDRTGWWMISVVHMVACMDDPELDWDSSWATLLFHSGAGDS
jgi:uncharacterized GH25 family protein